MDLFAEIKPLEQGLNASWKRNSVILNNIANNDTPGFKASSVEFETLYKHALETQGDGFVHKRTRATHMEIGSESTDDVRAQTVENLDTTYRMDDSNVDIDYEMSQFAKNVIFYNTLLTKVNSQFTQLRTAIKGQ